MLQSFLDRINYEFTSGCIKKQACMGKIHRSNHQKERIADGGIKPAARYNHG
ncbi:hypothetical protein [Anaerocolumna xylanovorans]|uniref:hypothetical protein n=1 Tax=Anaerocolumna xylanovorans TaxID=100134 RepID=UPI0015881C24|nr:hypothetical protein [Anaerocolumna xylanovorans]